MATVTDQAATEQGAEPSAVEDPRTPFREWPTAGRWTVYLSIGLVLVLIAGFAGAAAVVRRSLPTYAGEIRVSGLGLQTRISRDSSGIPTIEAATPADLFYAQGYAEAQDRFFEMDVARHRAAGRLAELLGPSAVPADMVARTLGWRRLAEQEYPALAPGTRAALRSFSQGVDEYLSTHTPTSLSMEYTLLELAGLNYNPEPWTPQDSLAVLTATAGENLGDVQEEVDRARLSVDHPQAQIADLYPIPRPGPHDAVDPGTILIAGSRTGDGHPILASALTTTPSVPAVWYQVGLHCTTVSAACPYDVSGVTRPGFPGVMAGHNAHVAWTLGSSGVDVADLVLEAVDGHNYLHGGHWVPLDQHDEKIRIQGAPSTQITVRSTAQGPLLSDVSAEVSSAGANASVPKGSPARGNGYAVALSAPAVTTAGRTADGLLALDVARDGRAISAAATDLVLPGIALSWAASASIGQQVLGPAPVRPVGDTGEYPVPGWLIRPVRRHASRPVTQAAVLPRTIDPITGVIAASDRARVLIGARTGLVPADLEQFLVDTRSPLMDRLVPALLRVPLRAGYHAEGQRLLAGWDGSQGADSAAAAYANGVWRRVLNLVFAPRLLPSLWPDGSERWVAIVNRLLAEPNSPWWDDPRTHDVVEDRDTVLASALRQARDEMTRRLAREPQDWSWGRLHGLRLRDDGLGQRQLRGLRALFDRGPLAAPGGPGTLFGGSYRIADGYQISAAPGLRMVVDLGAPDGSGWISMTGVSGHAFSGHYRDQTALWLKGDFLTWPFTDAAVRRASVDVLTLVPSG